MVNATRIRPRNAWADLKAPDPLQPLFQPEGAAEKGRQWLAMRRRRSQILAAARLLISEVGVENVHLHQIAARSQMAVQTLYNLVGDRATVLGASSEEWITAIATLARFESRRLQTDPAFMLIALCWIAAMKDRAYVDNATLGSFSPDSPLRRHFISATEREIAAELYVLLQSGELAPFVDVRSLARQLTLTANSTITGWILEPFAEADFMRDLINGPGLMLRAALKGAALERLERSLALVEP
jgi:AcrR family transcriptional regulator